MRITRENSHETELFYELDPLAVSVIHCNNPPIMGYTTHKIFSAMLKYELTYAEREARACRAGWRYRISLEALP